MTIITDPDRRSSLPHLAPQRGPCPSWCKDGEGGHYRATEWTYNDLTCYSDELFIPYAAGEPIKVEADDESTADYPPLVPSYLTLYLDQDSDRYPHVYLGQDDSVGLSLTLDEARDLREALGRLLDQAGESHDR